MPMKHETIINSIEISTTAYRSGYGMGRSMVLQEVTHNNSVLIEDLYLEGYNAMWSVDARTCVLHLQVRRKSQARSQHEVHYT
jgi:hypothetical protein